MAESDTIEVQNVNHPGKAYPRDRRKYEAARTALVAAFAERPDGMTQAEMGPSMKPHLPDALFPGGATAGWWGKTVQLDLEAKGVLERTKAKPTRWRLVAGVR